MSIIVTVPLSTIDNMRITSETAFMWFSTDVGVARLSRFVVILNGQFSNRQVRKALNRFGSFVLIPKRHRITIPERSAPFIAMAWDSFRAFITSVAALCVYFKVSKQGEGVNDGNLISDTQPVVNRVG